MNETEAAQTKNLAGQLKQHAQHIVTQMENLEKSDLEAMPLTLMLLHFKGVTDTYNTMDILITMLKESLFGEAEGDEPTSSQQ